MAEACYKHYNLFLSFDAHTLNRIKCPENVEFSERIIKIM